MMKRWGLAIRAWPSPTKTALLRWGEGTRGILLLVQRTREHPHWQQPQSPTPPIPRGGLAVVAHAHKCVAVAMHQYYSSSTSLSPTCIDTLGVVLCDGYREIPNLCCPAR